MPHTIFPSTLGFTWGVASQETGISVDSYRQHETVDVFEQKNNEGEVIALVTYNPKSEITVSGETLSGFVAVVGGSLTLANLLALGGVTTGKVIIKSIEFQQAREAMQKVTITASMYPLIAAV